MKQSIVGSHQLPESLDDARLLQHGNLMRFTNCLECGKPLANADAASTPAGWRETQINGICEPCFDALFEEKEL